MITDEAGFASHISIRVRVACLGAVAVFGLIALGLVYVITDQSKSKAFSDQRIQASRIASLRDFKAAIATARAAERDFLLRRREESAKDFVQAIANADAHLTKIKEGDIGEGAATRIEGLRASTRELAALFDLSHRAMRELGHGGEPSKLVTDINESRGAITKNTASLKSKISNDVADQIDHNVAGAFTFDDIFRATGSEIARAEAERLLFEVVVAIRQQNLPQDDTAATLDSIAQFTQLIFLWNEKSQVTLAAIKNNNNAFDILETQISEFDKELADAALAHEATFRRQSANADTALALLAGLILLATGILSILIGRSISTPLHRLEETTRRLAGGETDISIPLVGLRNELGSMSRALLVFRDKLVERQRLSENSATETAERQARQAKVETQIAEFRVAVSAVLSAVGSHAEQTRASARSLSQATAMAESQADVAAVASHQIASGASQVASAVEQLAAGVSQIAGQTQKASPKSKKWQSPQPARKRQFGSLRRRRSGLDRSSA